MSLESPGILMNDIKAETKNLFSYITAIIYNLFNTPALRPLSQILLWKLEYEASGFSLFSKRDTIYVK